MAINSKITEAINPKKYEIIRDRIAEILMAEFKAQELLQTDQVTKQILSETEFFTERFEPLNESELYAIVIFMANVDFDNRSATAKRGRNTFFIDFVGRNVTTNNEDGDKRSAIRLQILTGIVDGILSDPIWYRLGFETEADPFINTTLVTSIKRTEDENTREAAGSLMYRMTFEVIATENVRRLSGVDLVSSKTTVILELTDKGYQYFNPEPETP